MAVKSKVGTASVEHKAGPPKRTSIGHGVNSRPQRRGRKRLHPATVVEVFAALAGAALAVGATATGASIKRSNEGREALIRMTLGLEQISSKLEQLHIDFRTDRKELFGRLTTLESKVAKLEVVSPEWHDGMDERRANRPR